MKQTSFEESSDGKKGDAVSMSLRGRLEVVKRVCVSCVLCE